MAAQKPRAAGSLAAAGLAACVLASAGAIAQERTVDRVPTPFVEDGKAVTLEIVLFLPAGKGPFPVAMMNHGSTGRGNDKSIFTRTWANEQVARFFNERGWIAAFPQRRGRGKSDGKYDEGFEPGGAQYACAAAHSLPGVERAMQDLDAAVAYLRARPDVDARRMVIGGQSRGGILAIAYAGTRPEVFRGAVNFVGGWISDRCGDSGIINTGTFRRGAGFGKPTLWLYGEHDSFYRIGHSRENFEAFIKAGGKGSFLTYNLGTFANGHSLISHPEHWRAVLGEFIDKLD